MRPLEGGRVRAAIRTFARGFLDAVLPPGCSSCERVGREPFCEVCTEALLPASRFEIEGADRSEATFAYGGPVVSAIVGLKYHGRIEIGRALGELLSSHLQTMGDVDLVVPVPLSRPRLRERGFNQVREIARGLGLPVAARALIRSARANEREQVGQGRSARRENLRNAFGPGTDSVRGARVILLDDVVTTGATASAAVCALRLSKPRSVMVLSVAHTDFSEG